MVKKSTNLLGDRKTKLSLQKYQQIICFHSKGGLLVLVWISTVLIFSLYILCPLLGYLGGRHSRYRLLVIGTKLILAGFLMNSLSCLPLTYLVQSSIDLVHNCVMGVVTHVAWQANTNGSYEVKLLLFVGRGKEIEV